jgi:hypothetical protein
MIEVLCMICHILAHRMANIRVDALNRDPVDAQYGALSVSVIAFASGWNVATTLRRKGSPLCKSPRQHATKR